jgi:hypothetical protein
MEIRQEIAEKYWLRAAIEETATKYAAQGYQVTKDAPIGNMRADLVARKGNELIVVEFKLGDWSTERSNDVRRIRNEVVHQLGGKFNLVVVSPPKERNIEIEGIENILYGIFINDLGELDELSTHTQIEEVSDVTISSVDVEQNRIRVEGAGVVSVELNWGSNSDRARDEGFTVSDNFPFDFAIVLDNNLNLLEVESINVDTSSYEE